VNSRCSFRYALAVQLGRRGRKRFAVRRSSGFGLSETARLSERQGRRTRGYSPRSNTDWQSAISLEVLQTLVLYADVDRTLRVERAMRAEMTRQLVFLPGIGRRFTLFQRRMPRCARSGEGRLASTDRR